MRAILLLLITSICSLVQGQTIYVNHAATGANNGTSWTDAYVDLQVALNSIASSNRTVWIAGGTYRPANTGVNATFLIDDANTAVYGGFNGTETQLSERDWIANPTILSGDLLANDNTTIAFSNTTRNDNSQHLMVINANNAIVDGLILSDGHANGVGVHSSGAALYRGDTFGSLTIRNCEFKNNVSLNAAAGVHARFDVSGFLLVENTKFINNLATYATSFYQYTNVANVSVNVDIRNSLFENNKAIDNGATKGYAGSAGWFRAYSAGSTVNANFVNNTYVNNVDSGTNSFVVNRGTIGLSKNGSAAVYLNSSIYNCIFWNNTGVGGATSMAVNNIVDAFPTTLSAYNSLDSDNFSTVPTKLNIVTANPLFVSTSDFQLTNVSPAKDAGDNTYLSLTTDLNNNPRIVNTTIDMGAYENGDLCAFQVSSITDNSVIATWNPSITTDLLYVLSGQSISNGTVVNGILSNTFTFTNLTSNTSYDVYTSEACSGNSNSGWYLVSTFTTKGPIYVNYAATGLNDGSSWADAYTSLEDAFQNMTSNTIDIRVAQGTYKPSTSGLADAKKATFLIPTNAKIYGGFNGTETTLAQRDPKTNITILSGDLNDNDNSSIVYNNGLRGDNVFHVISLIGSLSGIVIDGFTITGGNANGSYSYSSGANSYDDTRGGAICAITNDAVNYSIYAEFKNCILEKNTGSDVGVYSQFTLMSNSYISVNFESCIFRNNQSSGSFSNIFLQGRGSNTLNQRVSSYFTNCLFHNNVSNGTSNQGASCITTYQNTTAGGSYTTAYSGMTNCTFTNNTGPSGHAISIIYGSNTTIVNSIIYNNGNTTPLYIFPSSGSINPSGFNNIIQGGVLGGTNVNPLFVSSSDFQLTSSSPAINAGNNSYLGAITTDLNGNARIVSGTVDLGVYEFDPALHSEFFNSFNDFEVYPNPTSSLLFIHTNEEISSMAIYSLDGKLVIATKENEADVSNLQNGLYLIKVTTNQNKVGIKKFVKK
ncbi:T9SS type A sorting domain-containing protein [Flavobacterium jejuense]|uniref:T9SS type A sorting domain-containing protein n=1 Tax=Flavobacterium jejuense TaxID=1544455 RepID=A0ABX0IY33_9FLAO|nr:T9SS type A sorting domain-containing protein [Flavobacterium jejuense]NHN26655.1 T9SS type A sorting domain-containing protein [Flavobacterium jejuense]